MFAYVNFFINLNSQNHVQHDLYNPNPGFIKCQNPKEKSPNQPTNQPTNHLTSQPPPLPTLNRTHTQKNQTQTLCFLFPSHSLKICSGLVHIIVSLLYATVTKHLELSITHLGHRWNCFQYCFFQSLCLCSVQFFSSYISQKEKKNPFTNAT